MAAPTTRSLKVGLFLPTWTAIPQDLPHWWAAEVAGDVPWNGWVVGGRSHPDVVPPMRAAVDAACRAVGRDPATLKRTLAIGVALGGRTIWGAEPVRGSPEEVAEGLRAFAHEGIAHVQVFLNPATPEGIAEMATVLECLDRG